MCHHIFGALFSAVRFYGSTLLASCFAYHFSYCPQLSFFLFFEQGVVGRLWSDGRVTPYGSFATGLMGEIGSDLDIVVCWDEPGSRNDEEGGDEECAGIQRRYQAPAYSVQVKERNERLASVIPLGVNLLAKMIACTFHLMLPRVLLLFKLMRSRVALPSDVVASLTFFFLLEFAGWCGHSAWPLLCGESGDGCEWQKSSTGESCPSSRCGGNAYEHACSYVYFCAQVFLLLVSFVLTAAVVSRRKRE